MISLQHTMAKQSSSFYGPLAGPGPRGSCPGYPPLSAVLGLSHLTQLRVGLRKLNFHKFQHNFRDTINPMCPSNDGIEDTEHFLLLCPSFGVQRTDLLAGIYSLVRPYGYVNLANDILLQILLYGDENFPNNLNRSILELTIRFIHSTGRFE